MKLQILMKKNKLPNGDRSRTCLAVITLDSAFKKDDNYQPQVLLKQCKYIEIKVVKHITDDLQVSFDYFDDSD